MQSRHRFLLLGAGLAFTYWLLEAALHTWVFADGDGWTSNLVPADANEWWMRCLAGTMILAFGVYAHRVERRLFAAEAARAAIQLRLDGALTRALRDFLPICAHCKAIREGESWLPLEAYIAGRMHTKLSHGLCPTCIALFEGSSAIIPTAG